WLFDRKVTQDSESYLVLESCYAFDRKKYVEKTVQMGEGLVGEVFREGQRIYLTEIPTNYAEITSGLGGASPSSILIEPLIFNDQVEGVLELASFHPLDDHELLFVQKISESLASTLSIHQNSQQTKLLLEQTQQQTSLMREQEEEMRVNMEELMFMQEESERQLKILEELKDLSTTREMVFSKTTILSESDIFGTITYCNDKLTEVSKYKREELLGQGHNIFRHPDMPKELFKLLWETIQAGDTFQGVIKNRAKDGSHYWVDATIVPITDEQGTINKYIGARYHIQNEELAQKMYADCLRKLGLG
ncbi:MAG: PAS domain-containing protein, partial [Cytophagales bacterium]|nr:PAS domain-containing protein [Cytophagales bacterium]